MDESCATRKFIRAHDDLGVPLARMTEGMLSKGLDQTFQLFCALLDAGHRSSGYILLCLQNGSSSRKGKPNRPETSRRVRSDAHPSCASFGMLPRSLVMFATEGGEGLVVSTSVPHRQGSPRPSHDALRSPVASRIFQRESQSGSGHARSSSGQRERQGIFDRATIFPMVTHGDENRGMKNFVPLDSVRTDRLEQHFGQGRTRDPRLCCYNGPPISLQAVSCMHLVKRTLALPFSRPCLAST